MHAVFSDDGWRSALLVLKPCWASNHGCPALTRHAAESASLMHIQLRLILVFLALLVFVLAASSWLLLRAHVSERAALERSARLNTQVLVREFDKGSVRSRPNAAPVLRGLHEVAAAARRGGWSGLLMDGRGQVVLAEPPELLLDLERSPERTTRLHENMGRSTEGWVAMTGASGEPRQAYFGRSEQDWAWVTLVPCQALDLSCSRELPWLVGAVLALGALAGLGLWRLSPAVRGGTREDNALVASVSVSEQQRMQIIGRLAGRFAHEFNNQLGIISNSAYLIRRRTQDPQLALPTQAMLRAVKAASLLIHRLQRLGSHQIAEAQVVDLRAWLSELQSALTVVLGKGMMLEMAQMPQPLRVHAASEELELALVSVLLCIREEFAGRARIAIEARRAEDVQPLRLPAGSYVEIRIEASAGWYDDTGGLSDVPVPARAMANACEDWGLSFARSLCRAAGGNLWVASEAGQSRSTILVLPEA